MGKLDYNFGRVGEAYSEYLGANFLTLEDEVGDYQRALDEEVNAPARPFLDFHHGMYLRWCQDIQSLGLY